MLTEQALVVHLFVSATSHRRNADYDELVGIWNSCVQDFGMTDPVPGLDLPTDIPPVMPRSPGTTVLGARQAAGDGVFQVIVRGHRDVLCLSVALGPRSAPATSWAELDRRWTVTAGSAGDWAMGESRLYLAYGGGGDTSGANVEAHVGAFLPDAAVAEASVNRRATVARDLTVWETGGGPDDRYLRRIVAVAPVKRWAQADAWAWSRGDPSLPPSALYFLQAAKMRYQLRVYHRRSGLEDLQSRTEAAVSYAMGVLSTGAQKPTGELEHLPTSGDMLAVRGVLSALVTDSAGLIASRSRMREMRATVDIAQANMAAVLRTWTPATEVTGLFADDQDMADWFSHQLADNVVYLDSVCDRAQEAASALNFVIENALQERKEDLQRREEAVQRRQDQVNLRQTAILGAILMILTAITAFGYKVSLPSDVVAAVVAVLGALALVLATVVLWVHDAVERPTWTAAVAAGFLGAAIGWLVTAAVHQGLWSEASPQALTVGIAAASFVAAASVTRWLAVWRRSSRSHSRGE